LVTLCSQKVPRTPRKRAHPAQHRPDSDADVAFDVLQETGINISPLPVWLDEWEHPENDSNPALLQNIASEGK
jgi:hypothetical protein